MKKRKFLRLLMLFGIWTIALSMVAQESRLIRGTVVATNGDALPGVNIIVKGTTIGTLFCIDTNNQILAVKHHALVPKS